MNWTITGDRPVYLQLIEQLELAIITGQLGPGARVPPVRELAAEAGVNPNTMQRALQELESRGLLQTQRTAGRTVTADIAKLNAVRDARARQRAAEFLAEMQALGLGDEEVRALLTEPAADACAAPPAKEESQ